MLCLLMHACMCGMQHTHLASCCCTTWPVSGEAWPILNLGLLLPLRPLQWCGTCRPLYNAGLGDDQSTVYRSWRHDTALYQRPDPSNNSALLCLLIRLQTTLQAQPNESRHDDLISVYGNHCRWHTKCVP
jgi:hypothetical protein